MRRDALPSCDVQAVALVEAVEEVERGMYSLTIPGGVILAGDALEQLKAVPDASVHCCITSPPYWGLRDYGVDGQIGLERTPEEYVDKLAAVFREVKRVLRKDGVMFLNLGDSYWHGLARGNSGKEPDTSGGGFSQFLKFRQYYLGKPRDYRPTEAEKREAIKAC